MSLTTLPRKLSQLEYIEVTGIRSPIASTTAEARDLRDMILEETHSIAKVVTQEEAAQASEVWNRAKEFLAFIEEKRKEVKLTPWQLCKDIDAMAAELSSSLTADVKRVGNVIAAYQAEQNRIAEQIKREAWEKEQAIIRERQRQEREIMERERRAQEELERKASVARNEANAAKYREQAEKARLEAEAAQEKRDEEMRNQIIANRQSAAVAMPVKQKGIATRKVMKFEVTDILALYGSAPYLCKIEANAQALVAALKQLGEGQSLPGVKHWQEDESVRGR